MQQHGSLPLNYTTYCGETSGLGHRARSPDAHALTSSTLPLSNTTQEHPDLPRDVTRLFADSLFKLDTSHVPQVAALRRTLGVERALRPGGQLPLWRPPLDVPFPPLHPAAFPPAFPEPPPPALELFDLDEEFEGPLVSGFGARRFWGCHRQTMHLWSSDAAGARVDCLSSPTPEPTTNPVPLTLRTSSTRSQQPSWQPPRRPSGWSRTLQTALRCWACAARRPARHRQQRQHGSSCQRCWRRWCSARWRPAAASHSVERQRRGRCGPCLPGLAAFLVPAALPAHPAATTALCAASSPSAALPARPI